MLPAPTRMVRTTRIAWATNPMKPVMAPVVVEVTALMPNFWKYLALVATRPAADGTAMLTNPIANCSTVVTPTGTGFGETTFRAIASVQLVDCGQDRGRSATRPHRASAKASTILSKPTSASPPMIVYAA